MGPEGCGRTWQTPQVSRKDRAAVGGSRLPGSPARQGSSPGDARGSRTPVRESAGAPASPPHAAWSPHGRRGAPCAPPGPVTRAARAGAAGSRCSRFQEPTAGGWTEARPGGRRCAGRGPRALPAVPGGPVPGQRPRRTPQDEAGQTASSGDLRRSLCGWVCESPAGAFLRTHRARFLGQHFWVVLLCPRPAGSSARGRAREG